MIAMMGYRSRDLIRMHLRLSYLRIFRIIIKCLIATLEYHHHCIRSKVEAKIFLRIHRLFKEINQSRNIKVVHSAQAGAHNANNYRCTKLCQAKAGQSFSRRILHQQSIAKNNHITNLLLRQLHSAPYKKIQNSTRKFSNRLVTISSSIFWIRHKRPTWAIHKWCLRIWPWDLILGYNNKP